MGKVNVWFQTRINQAKIEKSEPISIPKTLNQLLNSIDYESRILLKSFLLEKTKHDILDLESFIINPLQKTNSIIDHITNERKFKAAKVLCESLYYLSANDLHKAIKQEDFKSNIKDFTDEDATRLVDHKDQMSKFPTPTDYVGFTKHPEEIKGHWDANKGISAKLMHELWHTHSADGQTRQPIKGSQFYMTKPYHAKIDEDFGEITPFPLSGWATMATRGLFNAGGIGHLTEDVSVHEHEGHPVTVHKFNPQADIIYRHKGGDTDPLQIAQIGVMDFLTNNKDRHAGNLMSYPTKNGKANLLAIDHERNFGYGEPLDSEGYGTPETVRGYLSQNGHQNAMRYMSKWKSHAPLVEWWNKNGMNIQKEMANQVSSIKDPAIRKHVYDNFMNRWNKMDDWAGFMRRNPSHSTDPNALSLMSPATMIKFKQPLNQKILANLPKNPKDALSTIYDIVNRKWDHQKGTNILTARQVNQLGDIVHNIVKNLSPEEMADIYKSSLSNPNWNMPAIRKYAGSIHVRPVIMKHLYEPETYHNNAPEYKLNHIKAITDVIDQNIDANPIEKVHSDKLKGILDRVTRGAA